MSFLGNTQATLSIQRFHFVCIGFLRKESGIVFTMQRLYDLQHSKNTYSKCIQQRYTNLKKKFYSIPHPEGRQNGFFRNALVVTSDRTCPFNPQPPFFVPQSKNPSTRPIPHLCFPNSWTTCHFSIRSSPFRSWNLPSSTLSWRWKRSSHWNRSRWFQRSNRTVHHSSRYLQKFQTNRCPAAGKTFKSFLHKVESFYIRITYIITTHIIYQYISYIIYHIYLVYEHYRYIYIYTHAACIDLFVYVCIHDMHVIL